MHRRRTRFYNRGGFFVRFGAGILACLFVGCVAQPSPWSSPALPTDPLQIASNQHVLRIGLEFLPPDQRLPELEPLRVEPRHKHNQPTSASERALRTVALRASEPSNAPSTLHINLDAIDDPIARETMHFCSDLIAADQQRVRREVGVPFFDFRQEETEIGPLLTSERRLRQDHEQWSQQHASRLLRQPLRQLAKRMPIARDFELAIEDFRSDHLPLTEPYRKAHGDRQRLGRMSVRLHVTDLKDPMEIVYIHHSGVRVGSSQINGKLTLDFDLSNSINLSLRARTNYETGASGIRTDLIYRPSDHMSVHLTAGDDIDFLATSSIYSLFESPMDGSPGLVVYAVHTF